MSDPRLVDVFSRMYYNSVTEYIKLYGDPNNPNPRNGGGVAGAADDQPKKIDEYADIVNANKLFERIEPQLDSSDFYLLMVNGSQGSGKTVAARELAHLAHGKGYKMLYSSGFDIVDAKKRFRAEAGGAKKVCIVIDDVSYVISATSSKAQNVIKSYFAMIRHEFKAQVFVIMITHVYTAVPPIFKNSNVWLFSAPTTQELDSMIKIIGRNPTSKNNLQNMFDNVRAIQQKAIKETDIALKVRGKRVPFKWGSKHDPGDGRLMLLVNNGEPFLYNSHNEFCDECKIIGSNIQLRDSDYSTDRDDKEDDSDE